jgi:lipopolysaccharide export system protein LptA
MSSGTHQASLAARCPRLRSDAWTRPRPSARPGPLGNRPLVAFARFCRPNAALLGPVRRKAWWLAGLFLLVLVGGAKAQLVLQGPLKNFKFPDYYPEKANQTNRVLKTLITGAEAWQLPGGQMRIKGLRIESHGEDGHREAEVKASDCVLNYTNKEATGAGHLEVSSAAGFYRIEGDGFSWKTSNSFLFISNRVVATLQRRLLASQSIDVAALTNAAPATSQTSNEVVRVSSDQCFFDSQSNLIVQSGHVVADDPQMQLGCEILRVQFTPARRLQGLVAEEDVSILNKSDQSRATAGRAVYELNQGRETIFLTGQPVWRDREGRMEARADRFTFDRTDRRILGQGGAMMRLPRGSFSQPSLLPQSSAARTNAPPRAADTNQIQITSETLTLLLPATNRPARSVIVETGVVILSPADDTRATGDKAVYREESGKMELTGQARWEAEGRLVSADLLAMDRTNNVFLGRGNALFRMPLQQAGPAASFRVSTNRHAPTNLVLEVRSDELVYRTNALVFQGGGVRARVLEDRVLRGLITCETLTAHFRERLDRVVAQKRVMAENYPPAGKADRTVTNLLSCEVLTATFSEDGKTITIVAADDVQAAQVETRKTAKPKTTVADLTCGLLTATVLPAAGKVDRIVAEQHVVLSQEDKLARGGRAVYTDKENRVILSDHPYAEFAEGKVTGAETLAWDRATGAFRGRGSAYRIEWTRATGKTNTFRLPFLKK